MTPPARPWHGATGCFVIAEIGVNHNGDVDLARRSIDAAADAGADAVKFQTFDPDRIASVEAGLADYQRANLGPTDDDQRAMLAQLVLPDDALGVLADHARARGLEFFSTAFDLPSLELLLQLGVRLLKVPSGEVTNHRLLDAIGRAGRPVLCSTGMASLGEVETALDRLTSAGADDIVVLHCTSSYPAPAAEANLPVLDTLAAAFRRPVGYSDHTAGIGVAIAAAGRGARVIEKHLTLDHTLPGPDHRASLEPDQFAAMCAGIAEAVAAAAGDGIKRCTPAERSTRDVARRSVAYAVSRPTGHRLSADDLDLLRPGTGYPPAALDSIVGRRLARAVDERTLVRPEDLR